MDVKNDLRVLESALHRLERVGFPNLPRPAVSPKAPPTADLVNWSIQMYCFCLLAHFREMLRSLLLLTQEGHIPAVFAISRCLFEMGAQDYYVRKHLLQYLRAADLQLAWDFLFEINMGSRYMREEYGGRWGGPFPEPRDIAKVIRSFNEYIEPGWATSAYSFLSEFSHPNSAAFMHYFEWEQTASRETKVRFIAPSADILGLALGHVCIALVVLLQCTRELLEQAKESKVAPQLEATMQEIVGKAE